MAVTNVFREAVASNSVRKVRIMMEDSLLVDPTFMKFEEMERIAASIDSLYDRHDGRSFRQDKNSWNDAYMEELMVQAIENFSHERLNHLKEVVRYLRPVKEKPAPSYAENQRTSGYQEQKKRDMQKGDYRGAKVAAGAVIGAFIGGTVTVLAEAPVVAGALVGAAVTGTVTYIVTEGKE